MTAEPWGSVEQVARHLGVAKDTVYRWREHRGLPAHRAGGADEAQGAGSTNARKD